jgi:lysophospholipase L1-like esterase
MPRMPRIPPVPLPTPTLHLRSNRRPRLTRLAAVALASLLAACGGGSSDAEDGTRTATGTPPRSSLPLVAPGTWVVMGSSTAAGVGARSGQGWAALLAADMAPQAVTLRSLARSGLVSSQALPVGTALDRALPPPDPAVNVERALSFAPGLLLLSFPTNDTTRGLTPAQTLSKLETLGQHAAAAVPPAAVLVLSSQPRDTFGPAERAAAEEFDRLAAVKFGACFVRLRNALTGDGGGIAAAYAAGDGIHLNDAGHRLVFERVRERLQSGECVRLSP